MTTRGEVVPFVAVDEPDLGLTRTESAENSQLGTLLGCQNESTRDLRRVRAYREARGASARSAVPRYHGRGGHRPRRVRRRVREDAGCASRVRCLGRIRLAHAETRVFAGAGPPTRRACARRRREAGRRGRARAVPGPVGARADVVLRARPRAGARARGRGDRSAMAPERGGETRERRKAVRSARPRGASRSRRARKRAVRRDARASRRRGGPIDFQPERVASGRERREGRRGAGHGDARVVVLARPERHRRRPRRRRRRDGRRLRRRRRARAGLRRARAGVARAAGHPKAPELAPVARRGRGGVPRRLRGGGRERRARRRRRRRKPAISRLPKKLPRTYRPKRTFAPPATRFCDRPRMPFRI